MTQPLFIAVNGAVTFEGRPIREITRARIKSWLVERARLIAGVEPLNRLDSVWMQLTRASINANNQARKAA